MGYKCNYTRENYRVNIELSQEEYAEVLEIQREIQDQKHKLSQLLAMYERQEPSRVSREPLDLYLD